MALSSYLNLEIPQISMSNSELIIPAGESLYYPNDHNYMINPSSDHSFYLEQHYDPYNTTPTLLPLHPDQDYMQMMTTHLLPCDLPTYNFNNHTLPSPVTVVSNEDEFINYFPFQKRQKCFPDNYYLFSDQFMVPPPGTFFDGNHALISNNNGVMLPETTFLTASEERTSTRGGGGGGVVSAQSIAARERRRKITEKTQELGRLVPGGTKMNTAEMLQAAFNYVKFLQAQVGVLEFMGSCHHQESKEVMSPTATEEMKELLSCPMVQEKLCLEEKCLVPKEFAKLMLADDANCLKPVICNDLNQLVTSSDA